MSGEQSLQVRIESARIEHLKEIAGLAEVVWRAHYPGIISHAQIDYMLARMYDVEVMAHELATGVVYDRLLVNEELRGFSSYGPASDATELKLYKLYIHPGSQHRGFGGILLRRVEEFARDRGFHHLILAVNKQNAKAIAAYRKHGFTIREAIVTDIGGGFVMDDYIMVKQVFPASR